jgi:hypothetical protein
MAHANIRHHQLKCIDEAMPTRQFDGGRVKARNCLKSRLAGTDTKPPTRLDAFAADF